jgi:hypothetical protein
VVLWLDILWSTTGEFPAETEVSIIYLATKQHLYTLQHYLETQAPQGLLMPMAYEELCNRQTLPTAPTIFSDIERLSPNMAEALAKIWQRLWQQQVGSGTQPQLLNHPTQTLKRYELLRRLYEAGINHFNVYRVTECRSPQRFPVFIRDANEHQGNLTPLLNTQAELEQAIAHLHQKGLSREDKLIVEFCDTADSEGIYRKYSAYIIADTIIARHLYLSYHWMVKMESADLQRGIVEERDYVSANPHVEQLRDIFKIANVTYGRIDYSFLHDQIQVWEINTNPLVLSPQDLDPQGPQFETYQYNTPLMTAAFQSLHLPSAPPAIWGDPAGN